MHNNQTLVIGANGQIGKKTVTLLRNAGMAIKAMIRNQEQAKFFESLGAEVIAADLEQDFAYAFEGCNQVVFTAVLVLQQGLIKPY